ncbi:MAG: energy transducer TonB [bacterium]|nr:energy transducer TonB [bacterium]
MEPIYPSGALRKKIQGDVVLEVVTGPDGHVEKATVLSGHQLLREAAVKAAMQWVHDPTPVDGKPASRVFTVTLNFEMY